MFRYKLRTLLMLLAVLPPLLGVGWVKYAAWKAAQERLKVIEAEKARLEELIELTTWQVTLRAYSEPPTTPMQPEAVDVRKLTRPGAAAKAGEPRGE